MNNTLHSNENYSTQHIRQIKSFYNSGFDFQIPKKIPDNGFLGDLGSTDFNDIIEFTSPTKELYPGIYSADKWEEADCEQDTFSLCITSYADDLYELTILDGNRNQETYPADTYSPEMFQFLYSIEAKRGIKFPLTSQYNNKIFQSNGIILDKKQLFQFCQDMKIESTQLFQSGEYKEPIPSDEVKQTSDQSYEIINILPTDFYDNGTFLPKQFALSDSENGEVYITGLAQTLSDNILSKSNPDKFVDEIEFIIMPDDYVQIQLNYNKNISDKIDLIKKRKISLPLSKSLGLEKNTNTKIIIPIEQLNDFIKDFEINESIIPPTKKLNNPLKPLVCNGYRKRLLDNIIAIKGLNFDFPEFLIDTLMEYELGNPNYKIEKEKLFRKRKFWLFNKASEKSENNIIDISYYPGAQQSFQRLADITHIDINEIKRVWGPYYYKGDWYDMIGWGFSGVINAIELMLQKRSYKNGIHISTGFNQDQMDFFEKIFENTLKEFNFDIYELLDKMFDIQKI